VLQNLISVFRNNLLFFAYLGPSHETRYIPTFQIILQCRSTKLHINEVERGIAFELAVIQNLYDIGMASFAQFVQRTHFILDIFFRNRTPRSDYLPGEAMVSCWIVYLSIKGVAKIGGRVYLVHLAETTSSKNLLVDEIFFFADGPMFGDDYTAHGVPVRE
jgi:hypothetical protein